LACWNISGVCWAKRRRGSANAAEANNARSDTDGGGDVKERPSQRISATDAEPCAVPSVDRGECLRASRQTLKSLPHGYGRFAPKESNHVS
jgi:hypothetical protein